MLSHQSRLGSPRHVHQGQGRAGTPRQSCVCPSACVTSAITPANASEREILIHPDMAQGVENTPATALSEPDEIRAFLEENGLDEIEIVHQFVEGIGATTTTYDFINRRIDVQLPDSSMSISFDQLPNIASNGAEALASGAVVETDNSVQTVTAPATSGHAPISTMISKSDVCPYLVTVIGYGHDAVWAYALSIAGVNPAIGVLVGLGGAAFWAWVSSHC